MQRPVRYEGVSEPLVFLDRVTSPLIPLDYRQWLEARQVYAHPEAPGPGEQFDSLQHTFYPFRFLFSMTAPSRALMTGARWLMHQSTTEIREKKAEGGCWGRICR